jgi:hypothetical protein
MSKHLIAIIEVDEYPSDKMVELLSDDELLGSINDVFFENIDTPSDYSHFCFSTGPFSSNCSIVHFKEVSEDTEHIEESDTESILNVISELNRNVQLYLINASDFKLINENAGAPRLFSETSPFPITDINGSCLDVAEFE